MKRGGIERIVVERLAADGSGYAEIEGREVSVKGAVTGDVVDVRIHGLKRHSARVGIESFVSYGIERVTPRCPHFSICGGCRWQDVPYDAQCALKARIVRDTLTGIPGIEPPDDVSLIPSPDEYYYRNKMEFSFDSPPREEGRIYLGLHHAGRFDRVFDVEHCLLQSEVSNRLVGAVRRFSAERGLPVYGLKSHRGLLRYLMVRNGVQTGELMANIVTSGDDFPGIDELAGYIVEHVPETTTVLRSINRSKAGITTGEERMVLVGDGLIRETIGALTFTVSPDSFFQTNSRQTVQLYACVAEFAGLTGGERVLDLYCGTGTIGCFLASGAHSVTGIEMVGDAVRDARLNAERNGIGNIAFTAGKVEDIIDESMDAFDVAICDPPRVGIHPKALEQLVRMRIPRMVYVSCNITALARDLETLAMAGYALRDVRAFDMSPHTPHIETVARLEIA